ncbi:probable peptidoglycan muropeptide transporter SLC46 [Diachasmimorpha longicaudata]|uniref:probable peptidoglycan muropeptide transporter SLC46 n=1 Tax=Diachasmimorpha longicaudata TaxID=58733 RepID=UPI0030B88DAD
MESEVGIDRTSIWRRYSFIELPVFLCVCAGGMTATVFADLILYQTCRLTLGESHYDTCDILHTNSSSQAAMDLEKLIQPRASYILLSKSLIEGILPAFLSLFLGPWSDKHGRKPILIAAFTAPFLTFIILTGLTMWNLNPWTYLIASIPRALLGGFCLLMLSTFCYISDITNSENRAWRLACFENALTGGLVVGTFAGPLVFQKFGYTALFITAASISGLALLDIIFMIPESVKNPSAHERWTSPFDFTLVEELFRTATKTRPGLDRCTLWTCLLILSLYVVSISGEQNMGFLFASARLGWDVVHYSRFMAMGTILVIAGNSLGIKFFRWIGFSELSLGVLGAMSSFCGSMAVSFTFTAWHMYLGSTVAVFSGLLSPAMRSVLSKSVPPADVGKVFSLATSIDSTLPLATNPLYTLLYSNYMPPYYPSPVYLLSGTIFACILSLIVVIDRHQTKAANASVYRSLVEEN